MTGTPNTLGGGSSGPLPHPVTNTMLTTQARNIDRSYVLEETSDPRIFADAERRAGLPEPLTLEPPDGSSGPRPEDFLIVPQRNESRVRYGSQSQSGIEHLCIAAALRAASPSMGNHGRTQVTGATVPALRPVQRTHSETRGVARSTEIGSAVIRAVRQLAPNRARWGRPMRLLVLGTGTTAKQVVMHLLHSRVAPNTVALMQTQRRLSSQEIEIDGVWDRDQRRARALASHCGIAALSSKGVSRSLHSVDAVINTYMGIESVLCANSLLALLEQRVEPLLVFDLRITGQLDAQLAGRDGLQVLSIDQLQGFMTESPGETPAAVKRAPPLTIEEADPDHGSAVPFAAPFRLETVRLRKPGMRCTAQDRLDSIDGSRTQISRTIGWNGQADDE